MIKKIYAYIQRVWIERKWPYLCASAKRMYLDVYGQLVEFQRRQSVGFDTVVFGSSHAHKSYLAQERDFNFANSHVDLYTAASLFHKICASGAQMRRAVLFYDVFSSGFEMQKTSGWFKFIPYQILFDIPFYVKRRPEYNPLVYYLEHLDASNQVHTPFGNNCFDWFFPPDTDVVGRVASHIQNHRRGNGQDSYAISFIKNARHYGIKPFIVTSPLRSDYLHELDKYEDVFASIYLLCKHYGVPFFDFSHSKTFNDNDFGDLDHLNKNGAVKLTKQLNELF